MYIIFMADIANSQKLEQPQVQQNFINLVKEVNTKFKNKIFSPLTITLGDEFQGVVKEIKYALEIIIFIEESLVKVNSTIKLRYVVLEGEIDTEINHLNAWEMVGKGLTDARKKLTELKQKSSSFYFQLNNVIKTDNLNNLFTLYLIFAEIWGRKNGELINQLLHENDYKKVAKTLGKNSSLIWKRKKSLKIDAYHSFKKLVENV